MLPSIVEIAEDYGLRFDASSRNREEVRCKCPFCHEDDKPNKERRYYLSLNSKDQVFRCWFCGEKGGVFRFISLLKGISEEEVRKHYRKRKVVHPAERLSSHQRTLLRQWLGGKEPDWRAMRERDYAYYKRSLDLIWQDWNEFIAYELQQAYFFLLLGIRSGKYQVYVERIRRREKEIEWALLQPVCEVFSQAERPAWTNEVESRVERYFKLTSVDLQRSSSVGG